MSHLVERNVVVIVAGVMLPVMMRLVLRRVELRASLQGGPPPPLFAVKMGSASVRHGKENLDDPWRCRHVVYGIGL